jgi:hypothetical protein
MAAAAKRSRIGWLRIAGYAGQARTIIIAVAASGVVCIQSVDQHFR